MVDMMEEAKLMVGQLPLSVGHKVWVKFRSTPKSKWRIKIGTINTISISVNKEHPGAETLLVINIFIKDEDGIVECYAEDQIFKSEIDAAKNASINNITNIERYIPNRTIGKPVDSVDSIREVRTKYFNKVKGSE